MIIFRNGKQIEKSVKEHCTSEGCINLFCLIELQILSNGIYSSVEHRAVVNSAKERLSIATFLNPRFDAELGPAPSLITPQNPAKFGRVGVADYFKGFFGRRLDGKSYIDVMRIQSE